MSQEDDFSAMFAPEDAKPQPAEQAPGWKVLLVDDEPGIHSVFRMALQGVHVEGRSLQFLDAASAREARECLIAHPDIALVLLDVVMETEDAGLNLVRYIRQDLGNHAMQIILITGQPGYAPLREVIGSFEINNYLAKAELTADKVFSAVYSALRTYRVMRDMQHQGQQVQLAALGFSHARDGIVITDARGAILDVNDSFVRITGYSREEVLGQNPSLLKSGKQDRVFYDGLWQALMQNGYWSGEIWNRRKNGELYLELLTISAVRDANGVNCKYLALFSDVTERKRAQDTLQQVYALLDETQRIGKVGGWEFDTETGQQTWTEEVYRIHELDADHRPTVEKGIHFYTPASRPVITEAVQRAIEQGESFNLELEITTAKGNLRCVHVIGKADLPQHRIYGFIQDITEQKKLEEKVRLLAFYDALTDLPNRRLLIDRLNQAMTSSKRTGRYGALVFLDLDNFKPLNDAHGHEAGDRLLLEVARRLRACVREIDTVSRFGGDEFSVLLSELATDALDSTRQAEAIAEKIRAALAQPYALVTGQAGGQSITVEHCCTASLGVVIFTNHECSQDELFRRADAAMYQAKKDGRNRIRYFKDDGGF